MLFQIVPHLLASHQPGFRPLLRHFSRGRGRHDVAEGWLLYDRVALTAVSQPVSIAPGQSLDLSAAVRGELAGPAGQVSGQLAAHFYDSQGNLLSVSPIWQAAAYNQPTTPCRDCSATIGRDS